MSSSLPGPSSNKYGSRFAKRRSFMVKNANVFYELGLAHAARKPVVFISGNVQDVPFDLRHLRVIIYDINDLLGQTQSKLSPLTSNAKRPNEIHSAALSI